MMTFAIVPILALHVAGLQPAAGPPGFPPLQIERETDTMRVARVRIAPGARLATESAAGSVLVFLTADLDGRMPASEAVWQAPGPIVLENRGPARFEAILVQFKTSAGAAPRRDYAREPAWGMVPAYAMGDYGSYGFERIRSTSLIDTPDVQATRLRYPGTSYWEPLRMDAGDTVVVYLRNGYAWPLEPDDYRGDYSRGPVRVYRGDVRVIPTNVPYALTNPSADASEVIVIAQR